MICNPKKPCITCKYSNKTEDSVCSTCSITWEERTPNSIDIEKHKVFGCRHWKLNDYLVRQLRVKNEYQSKIIIEHLLGLGARNPLCSLYVEDNTCYAILLVNAGLCENTLHARHLMSVGKVVVDGEFIFDDMAKVFPADKIIVLEVENNCKRVILT